MYTVILLCIFFIMMFVNNIYGKNIGEISKSYNIKQTPPPITFSIWGLIYIGVFFAILYNKWSDHTSILFIISCIFNCLWLYFFSEKYEFLQLVSIVGICIVLCLMYYTIIKSDSLIDKSSFGIYLGWISIALLLSILIYLKKYNLSEKTLNIITVLYLLIMSISLYVNYKSVYLLMPYLLIGLVNQYN
jgi:benzodiazapine receptor